MPIRTRSCLRTLLLFTYGLLDKPDSSYLLIIMMHYHRLFFLPLLAAAFLALASLSACNNKNNQDQLNDELSEIDRLIKQLPAINRGIEQKLDSITDLYEASSGKSKIERALELTNQYRLFNADSSLFYANAAVNLSSRSGNQELIILSRLNRVSTLATLGIFTDARKEYENISADSAFNCSNRAKIEFFDAGRTLYSYISRYLTDAANFYEESQARYRACNDSLIALLPPDSPVREFLTGENLASDGKYNEAEKVNSRLLAKLNPNTRLYAMTCFQLAGCYRIEGNQEEMAVYLAKGARGDIKAGVREGLALPMLANYLYAHGDLDQAYRYINVSLQDAASGGMRWRAYAIALTVPGIDDAYQSSIAKSKRKLIVYSGISTICFLVSAALLFMVYRQRKKLHDLALQLNQKAKLQASYMGNFIAMCASYADRLNRLTAVVDRKLSAGDTEGLRKMIKSGKYMEGDDEDFYRIFDAAFLDIYPDFVTGLNLLLKDDEQLSWKAGKPLTPELRIYALVRLGVSEGTRIAQILRYSVSTVYAYRNRMRNRAIDRDNFENDVMHISAQIIPVA